MAIANRRVSFGFGALAAALLLGGIALLAAPSAQAGLSTEAEAALAACLAFELITEDEDLCGIGGPNFNCEPEMRDCERFCRLAGRGCFRTTRADAQALNTGGRAVANASKVLCGTIADAAARSDCKAFVRALLQAAREDFQIARGLLREACNGDALVVTCEDECNVPNGGIICVI